MKLALLVTWARSKEWEGSISRPSSIYRPKSVIARLIDSQFVRCKLADCKCFISPVRESPKFLCAALRVQNH